jgi:DNA/RNA endonuclease G, NUC1
VSLRDNQIVDVLDDFLHYKADTEPGSSGSPAFNDQWEIVALHHASVPAPDHAELGGYVNEGIRVSRLVAFIEAQNLSPAQQVLVNELTSERSAAAAPVTSGQPASASGPQETGTQTLRISVPIDVSARVGTASGIVAPSSHEAVTIDPDFANRRGYDPEFLGTGALAVSLPELADGLVAKAAVNSMAKSEPRYVLPYHHFSLVLNKSRGLAFYTAVNIDGPSGFRLKRESDHWYFDPRVPKEQQTGEDVYVNNELDRGHLVRRLDPAWGTSAEAAKICNDDTFHFTNCTPQHRDFNERTTLWAGLEDYILDNADNLKFRVTVFSGPVFADDDDEYREVQLPRQFWKVVVMVKEDGSLSATGYLLSQESLIKGLEIEPEAFSYGAYMTYQVAVQHLETLTGLSFGSLRDVDPLGLGEAFGAPRKVSRQGDIVL